MDALKGNTIKGFPTERSKVQLSTLHGNNGVVVQTEPSAGLASLASQLIRRQGAVSSGWVGVGGQEEEAARVCLCVCVCVTLHGLCDW